jgi:hypothetical protein
VITNSRLHALLGREPAGEISVPPAYQTLVAAGFNQVQGCLLFKEFSAGQTSICCLDRFGDETGYEGSANGHHLVDYLPRDSPRDDVAIAHTALACARFLALHLGAATGEPCRVSFSVRDSDSVISFHTLREDQPPQLVEDLEEYLEEAVGYLDTTDADLTAARA